MKMMLLHIAVLAMCVYLVWSDVNVVILMLVGIGNAFFLGMRVYEATGGNNE